MNDRAKWFSLLFWLALLPGVALAQSPALDRNQPIEITADELEVRQNEQQAIFKGNVLAEQGSITMRSARMVVHYRSGGGDGDGSGGAAQSAVAGAQGIAKIIADGGVFFASPRETAKGANAVYDVDAEQIRMSGDVTLTRDKSVVKGSHLVYHLRTGRSVLTSGGGVAGSRDGSGRVRGLFIPQQE